MCVLRAEQLVEVLKVALLYWLLQGWWQPLLQQKLLLL
jgi:hypothetical protein